MKLKFSNSLDDIHRHYQEIDRELGRGERGASLLDSWGIDVDNPEQLAQIKREQEALRYLTSCNVMLAHGEDALKPDMEDLESAFNRHLTFLGEIFNCHLANWRNEPNRLVKGEYEACRHYLSQLTLPAWTQSLPERVYCYPNKHPKPI